MVFVVVLELFGRDGLAEVEGEGVEDVVLGRGECLGLWQLAAAELDRTGGHFSFARVSVLVFDEGVRTRVSAERTGEHGLVFLIGNRSPRPYDFDLWSHGAARSGVWKG